MADIQATANRIVENVERVIVGKRQSVQLTVLGLSLIHISEPTRPY